MMRAQPATARPAAQGHRRLQCRAAAGRALGLHYDRGDPLLWIESIPYWETRYYVPAVLRNMWVYQGLGRRETPTLTRAGAASLAGISRQPERSASRLD